MTIIGPTNLVQPLLMAKAAAVVGPPILALQASITSSMLNLNNLPTPMVMAKLMMATMNTNTNNSGALVTIKPIEAGIPMTTKNR